MRKTIIMTAIVAGALTLSIATPAMARDESAAVRFGDLDLSRPDDAVTLRHRVSNALDNLCGTYATAQSDQTDQVDRCRAEARASFDAAFARVMNERKNRRLAAR